MKNLRFTVCRIEAWSILPPPPTSKILSNFAYELTDQMSNYQLFKESFERRAHDHRLHGQAWREVTGLSLIC
jgi:hypothetical protein